MKRFLESIASKRPVKHITDPEDEKYLERYFLFHIPLLNITCYLHHFVGSDPDRGLHSHPWKWAYSIILSGHYKEIMAVEFNKTVFSIVEKIRLPGTIHRLKNDSWHRVILPPQGGECWTLFIHGSRVSGWGFLHYIEHEKINRCFMTNYEPYTLDRSFPDFKWWKKDGRQI